MIVIALGLGFIADAPASADTRFETRQFTVSRAGLDLTNPADAAVLYRRVEDASREVCRFGFGPRPLSERGYERACIARAIADAVEAINAPAVTALHQERQEMRLAWAR
jgi:UrcA family protein